MVSVIEIQKMTEEELMPFFHAHMHPDTDFFLSPAELDALTQKVKKIRVQKCRERIQRKIKAGINKKGYAERLAQYEKWFPEEKK